MNAFGKVLIVDDEPEFRDVLADYLAREGYAVVQAASGEEALECVQQSLPDVVLLDIAMPGVNGLEVLRRLHRDHPGLPIIMLTGIDEDEALARSTLRIGAVDYVCKPFRPEHLSRVVLAAMSKSSR